MAFRKILVVATAFVLLSGAAPGESGYSQVPKKREAVSSKSEIRQIREESVRPEEVAKNGVQEFALIATDTGYLPNRLIVRNNIPVHLFLTSASARKFCFILDEFSIRKGMENQQAVKVEFLPTKAGPYKFYCPIGEIQGTLIVRD